MIDALPEKDLIGLGYWGLGFRNATNSRRPIAKVEDFAGLKLRVIPNPVYLETFKAFKANPVPMNFGELYTALENKTVDGQENPYTVILSNKFYEVQKYVSATNHTFTQNIIIVSKKFWDRLSPDEQKMIRDTSRRRATISASRPGSRPTSRSPSSRPRACSSTRSRRPSMRGCGRRPRRSIEKFSADYDQEKVKLFNAELERVQQRTTQLTQPARRTAMARLIDLYCRALKVAIALCLAVMVVLVFGNVVLRYVFNSGIAVSEELSRWLLVWLTFLGAIVALREHAHLGVDTLVRALPPTRQAHLLRAELRPDALCRLAAARRQLEADAHHCRGRAPATSLSVGFFYAPASCSASRPA